MRTLPEEEWEVHHRDHKNRKGCGMDRVALMEEVWKVVHGAQSMLKTGLNRPLMREILDNWDEYEGRMSKLLIDLATDKSEAKYPIKVTQQENSEEVVYLSRTRKGTMRSKMMIDKINDIKMKLGNKVTLRKTGKTKVDSELSAKAVNSAKRKRIEDVMDMRQGDYRLPGTSRTMADVAMVPSILNERLRLASYRTKRSDHTLTGATLEMEMISQCDESTHRVLRPSCMIHGKGSVIGQLTPVKYNRFTVSDTVSIDEPAGGYVDMMEYRKSARGQLIALEN